MIGIIFFDWFPVSKDNPQCFGQITFADIDGDKLSVLNFDCDYEDLFRLLIELMREHCQADNIIFKYKNFRDCSNF